MADRKIRVGVVGASRGASLASHAPHVGMELVAVCDNWDKRLQSAQDRFPQAVVYSDFDSFLEHDMDAVILANYFHQHAPLAVKALCAGRHVMSETSACITLGQAAELSRAVEQSGRIYMFAENYAYFAHVQEMRRLYQLDEIGEIRYAEGEYNHPMSALERNRLSPGLDHWRNNIPSTYYCTHALSPLLYVTDSRPIVVNAQSIQFSEKDEQNLHVKRTDMASVILIRLDNGAMARLMGTGLRGHSVWYRFHGTRGLMENLRSGDSSMLRVVHEAWDRKPGDVAEKIYKPDFPEHADLAAQAGHGGGDFFVAYRFAEAIRTGEQPWMNVYRAIDMSIVGIQAWRSCLSNGAPVEVPDFRDEAVRQRYESDDWSPMPEDRKPGQPWPSIQGEIRPTHEAISAAGRVWKDLGYEDGQTGNEAKTGDRQ